jgi:hypothetical protein
MSPTRPVRADCSQVYGRSTRDWPRTSAFSPSTKGSHGASQGTHLLVRSVQPGPTDQRGGPTGRDALGGQRTPERPRRDRRRGGSAPLCPLRLSQHPRIAPESCSLRWRISGRPRPLQDRPRDRRDCPAPCPAVLHRLWINLWGITWLLFGHLADRWCSPGDSRLSISGYRYPVAIMKPPLMSTSPTIR